MQIQASAFAQTRYIRNVQERARPGFGRWRSQFFLWASLAGLSLRMAWAIWLPGVVDDSRLYANISENWLRHGIYGITNSGTIMPTLSRLPGYPAFLAAVFAVFGMENYRAVLIVQTLIDLGTCFLIADIAWRLWGSRSAKAAFLLAALCPFLANYAASALTETLEIFFTTLAFNLAVRGLGSDAVRPADSRRIWLACGLSVGGAILLRPDGGILLAAIGGYLLWLLVGAVRTESRRLDSATEPQHTVRTILWAGSLLALGALAPLIPWTMRNLHTLHRFEPLAPRYATDSDDLIMPGFNRWVKTWTADYVSVQEVYWQVPGSPLDVSVLPKRAFDSPQEREKTQELFDAYNRNHEMTRELDDGFAGLAAERVHDAPLRYYIGLPALRIADMWLRPRTELLPSDPRWWEFNDDPRWLAVSLAFGIINLSYIVMAGAGLVRSEKFFCIGLFVFFILLRSLFLGTLENPEPRYTLECYPLVIVLAAALFHRAE
jgi:hypothetical protein